MELVSDKADLLAAKAEIEALKDALQAERSRNVATSVVTTWLADATRCCLNLKDATQGCTSLMPMGSFATSKPGGQGPTPRLASRPFDRSRGSGKAIGSLPLVIVIFGATGDLARKKLFPAIYQLILHGYLPRDGLKIVGYGRSPVDLDDFLAKQCAKCAVVDALPMAEYKSKISFYAGGYDDPAAFQGLDSQLNELQGGSTPHHRLFFLSVPPTIFGIVCSMIKGNACAAGAAWTRLIIEKPFGRDSASFAALNEKTSSLFDEAQLYRIDHYLGKEVILNMGTLRWANQVFEPIWGKEHVASVEILWKEDLGTGGRGGYFDQFGIIRDIMQNHLLQAFTFASMEIPATMSADDILRTKVELLQAVETLRLDDAFLGQFTASGNEPGYLDDPTVPAGSRCPTFASVVLRINNKRWRGVPFVMRAGKGLDERLCEVRMRMKPRGHARRVALGAKADGSDANELVMRIQPDEALYMNMLCKEPGLGQHVKPTTMDMTYSEQFQGSYSGDAYERMFLNAVRGDQSLFVSAAELTEAWRIFTPLLHAIDERQPQPVLYPFGVESPAGYKEWASARGI